MKTQLVNSVFLPHPCILTCGRILVLSIAFLFGYGSVQADILVLKQTQPAGHDWSTASDFDNVAACTGGFRVVNSGLVIRTPQKNEDQSINSIYLGYTYDVGTGTYTVVGDEARSQMGLKNQGANTVTIENLYLGNGQVLAWGLDKPTLAGKIYVEGARSEINAQDALTFYISSQIVKVTPDACLDLVPYNKSGTAGEIWVKNSSNLNCPLNLKNGKVGFDGENTYGSDFALTLQDGTGIVLGSNFLGAEGTTITINGTVRYVHYENATANKISYSNVLIPANSTLNALNNYGDGAIGSMVFAGDLQGAGALVVNTVGTKNTNSLTLGHSENSFTGKVNVTGGKLQFTVPGYDNVTYTGTNALINAESVTVASGATIDVGATTQTFNNLSGAGTVTVSDGGSLTLNYTSETIFSGIISSTEEVIKTGNGTLRIDGRNDGSTNIDCPLNVNQGQLHLNGTDLCGSNFALTLQDGTSVLLSGNNIGKPNTTITVNGSVRYGHWQNTSANKVCYSNLIVTEGSTFNAINNYDVGAKGSMVFAGELQGAGTLVVNTVGSTNTNSLTLGHSENSFTGKVNVTGGKLRFNVLGYDEVTYTGTNALINAESVTVASGATIDVGATTQTFNNLSGAGNVTTSEGGSLTLNNTDDTEFSGVISGPTSLTKTGTGALTLSQAPAYTGNTTIESGTLALTAGGTLYNLSGGSVGNPVTLEATDKALTINVTENEAKRFIGSITASSVTVNAADDAPFQIYTAANGLVDADSFVVSSGRVDVKGYMKGAVEVGENATFSPGNSVGNVSIDGDFTLNGDLLIEVDATGADTLVCDGFTLNGGTVILNWQDDEIPFFATCDLITSTSDLSDVYANLEENLDFSTSPKVEQLFNDGYITLALAGDSNNIIRLSIDRNAVPEPSTWALLALGVIGLMYWRKRK